MQIARVTELCNMSGLTDQMKAGELPNMQAAVTKVSVSVYFLTLLDSGDQIDHRCDVQAARQVMDELEGRGEAKDSQEQEELNNNIMADMEKEFNKSSKNIFIIFL